MGKPAIPKYGKWFMLIHLPYDRESELADRMYAYKRDATFYIQSNRSSEKWYLFHDGKRIGMAETFRRAIEIMLSEISAFNVLKGIAEGKKGQ